MANVEPSVADARVVLGIAADATPDQVVSAFRRLAREVHPDVSEHRDAGPRFDALVAAYRIASRAAAREGRTTDSSGGGPVRAEQAPVPSTPSGRRTHDVLLGTSGTLVREGGRPILFVSVAVHAPSGHRGRAAR
jgi:hypothetical protein